MFDSCWRDFVIRDYLHRCFRTTHAQQSIKISQYFVFLEN
jgi:hypothetical protein